MTEQFKKQACDWINNPKRDYDEGVLLYSKLGKNRNIKKVLERKTAEKGMHILLYNLEKVTGHKFTPGKKELTDDELKALFIGGKVEGYDYFEAQRLVKLFGLKPKGRKKADVFAEVAKGPIALNGLSVSHVVIDEAKDCDFSAATSKAEGRIRVKKNPTIEYDKLPADLKILFNENGKLEGEKKSVHAKMTALDPDAKNDKERKEFANRLLEIEKSQAANWKVLDDWWAKKDEPKTEAEQLSPAAQATKDAEEKAKKITNLKSQASRRTGKLKKMKADDPKRKKLETELAAIVSELKELGVDYKPRK